MSQQDSQYMHKRSLSTRSAILLVLIVGLGAGIAAYSIGNALAATSTPNQQSSTDNQWYGPRAWDGQRWNHTLNDSFTSFRALSTATNVTVTGFAITDSTHITVTLSYRGSGSAPALTVVAVDPGLSGSNTVAAGWGTSTTLSVLMVGQGSLTSGTCLRVLVTPLTGP